MGWGVSTRVCRVNVVFFRDLKAGRWSIHCIGGIEGRRGVAKKAAAASGFGGSGELQVVGSKARRQKDFVFLMGPPTPKRHFPNIYGWEGAVIQAWLCP